MPPPSDTRTMAEDTQAFALPEEEQRNSSEPQHFPGFPGTYAAGGQPVTVDVVRSNFDNMDELKGAAEGLPLEPVDGGEPMQSPHPAYVDVSSLKPGEPIPLPPSGAEIAAAPEGSLPHNIPASAKATTLADLTKIELSELASDKGVEFSAKATKAQMVEALTEAGVELRGGGMVVG